MTKTQAVKAIRAAIESDLKRDKEGVMCHDALAGIIAQNEGKKPTKRVATALAKMCPHLTVRWCDEYGMYHVHVWGDGFREYKDRVSMLVGYHGITPNPTTALSRDEFEDYDCCHGSAARDRIKRYQALLRGDRIEQIADAAVALKQAEAEFEKALGKSYEDNPSVYSIQEAVGIEID